MIFICTTETICQFETGCCPKSFAIKFWGAVRGFFFEYKLTSLKKDSPDGLCESQENSNIVSGVIWATACQGLT
jgi:hypothetical protein